MTHPVSLTFNFPTLEDAAAFLAQRAAPLNLPTIDFEDRPDVGRFTPMPESTEMFPPLPAAVNPFAVATEAAVVPAAPTAPTAPPAPAAAPSPASAPAATAAVPPATVDSAGLPWDGRIHAPSKKTNADGKWRQKRGTDDALVVRVETELRAAMAARAPSPTAASTAPAVFSAPVPESLPAASPATTPSAPAAPAGETFGQLMARLAPVALGDPAKAAKLNEALAAFQLTSLAQLAARQDLVPAFGQAVDAMLATA